MSWKPVKRTLNGKTFVTLGETSNYTHSSVKIEALTLKPEIAAACNMARNVRVTSKDLRIALPELDKWASDFHLDRILNSHGDESVDDLFEDIISDAAIGHKLTPATVRWYANHELRPKKQSRRGRPRKRSKIEK